MRNQSPVVAMLAACAAVFAQAAPQACYRDCDRPCCAAPAEHGGHGTAGSARERAGGCPLCPAPADRCLDESSDSPCRCQFTAREELPLAPNRGTVRAAADGDAGHPAAPEPRRSPPSLGVSREYVAACLAVPIRPPRILFGVWRN